MRLSTSTPNNIPSNINPSTSHQQILCLPHPQQQQFLSTSLNSQQLAQLGSFPVMSGAGNASRIVQLGSVSSSANNFAMFTTSPSLIQNEQGKLMLIDIYLKYG